MEETNLDYPSLVANVFGAIGKDDLSPRQAIDVLCVAIGLIVAMQAEPENILQVVKECSRVITDVALGPFEPSVQ
jgi:hypothetical protein